MRVYLAGPMTGIPQFNIPAFDAYAADLRLAGYDVVSPAELDDPETRAAALASPDGAPGTGSTNGETWGDFLSRDVKLIADGGIEGVVLMPRWERSRGARLETYVAHAMLGLPVYTWDATYRTVRDVEFLDLVRAWTARGDISFHAKYVSPLRGVCTA
jgi:hypothetical protein